MPDHPLAEPEVSVDIKPKSRGMYHVAVTYGDTAVYSDEINLARQKHRAAYFRRLARSKKGKGLGKEAIETITERVESYAASLAKPRAPRRPAPAVVGAERPGALPLPPTVVIDTDEYRVIDEACEAIKTDPQLYRRGNTLVHVQRDSSPQRGVTRPAGAPTIAPLPAAKLRDRLTAAARFVQLRRRGDEDEALVPAHPAEWLVKGVHARGDWPGVRHIEAVAEAPILRPDGTVLQTPGYDPLSGVLYEPSAEFPRVPDEPSRDDAVRARDELLEVIHDFPFAGKEHRAAGVAGLLTPMARIAVGNAPIICVDANTRGSGKGLYVSTVAEINLGRPMAVVCYSRDDTETRKLITSLVVAGDRMVAFDNIVGAFGNSSLDAAVTGSSWKDRLLGGNLTVDLPLVTTWYATGNNLTFAADTARRACHVRLETLEERPEDRSGFKHPNLLGWVRQNRPRLVAAGLTLLRAYFAAGCPDMKLRPWGSFEGWSAVVRQSLVWVDLEDPGATRIKLQEQADTSAETLGLFIDALARMDPGGRGMTVAAIIERVFPKPDEDEPEPAGHAAMRSAILDWSPGGKPSAGSLGNKLRAHRRRVIGGRYIDRTGDRTSEGARWKVCGVQRDRVELSASEADRGGEAESTPHAGSGDGVEAVATDTTPRLRRVRV